ncbi:MAG: cytochrome bc complex cytochrome b subunit [Candidatus Thermoplasmatota archaeon]|nr:cytochrome bc complex cytochrome b subunit [Candidatus Thermoplasmatota archaeon]
MKKNLLPSFRKKKSINERMTATFGEDPLGINDLPFKTQPDYMRGKGGIWYWTGAMTAIAFFYQIVSGLILLLYYNPADAYASTETFLKTVPYGALILTTHLYGAYAMIVLIYIHLYRNYFTGAYKKPRQIQWVLGVILLALTVGVGYFGYSLTGDILSTDATDVGRGIAMLIPIIGKPLEEIGFGNGTSTGLFIRFLGWHIIFTALIGALFGLHFFLAENHNFKPAGYKTNYKAPAMVNDYNQHKPWYPYNFVYMIQLSFLTIGFIILIPSVLGLMSGVPALFSPFPQVSPTSPLAPYVPPYPPWFLLFLYKAIDFQIYGNVRFLLAISPLATSVLFGLIPLLYFIIVPFIDTSNELHPLARPKTTAFGILGIIYMIILSAWGALSPGIQIPYYDVALVLIPPFIIVMGGMLFLGRMYRNGTLKVTGDKLMVSTLVFIVILIAAVISLSYNFAGFLANSSALNFTGTLFSGGVTAFAAFGTAKSADYTVKMRTKEISNGNLKKPPIMSKKNATILGGILAFITLIIMGLSISVNPIYKGSLVFGIGLGISLLLASVVTRLYRMVAYDE